MGDELEAWQDACERLAAIGRRLGDDDFPAAEADRADGIAHMVEQTMCWTGWSVFHADPRRPRDEHRMRPASASRKPFARRRRLPGKERVHHTSSTMRARSART